MVFTPLNGANHTPMRVIEQMSHIRAMRRMTAVAGIGLQDWRQSD
jgi:hypothetical protein